MKLYMVKMGIHSLNPYRPAKYSYIYIYTLEVQDQTKNGLLDDPCKGFPTTHGQSLVFGLPGYTLEPEGMFSLFAGVRSVNRFSGPKI